MNMWMTLADVASEFDLTPLIGEPQAMVAELKVRLANSHPDRTGGTFASELQQREYLRTKQALDFVERQTALVPVGQIAAALQVVAAALAPQRPTAIDIRREALQSVRTAARGGLFAPKLTSGVFLAVASALFVLLEQIEKTSVLRSFFGDERSALFIIQLWLISGVMFVVTWLREQSAQTGGEYFTSDDGVEEVFDVLREKLEKNQRSSFTIRDVRQIVDRRINPLRNRLQRLPRVGRVLLWLYFGVILWPLGGAADVGSSPVAKSIVATLLERGAIKKTATIGATVQYALVTSESHVSEIGA